MKKILLFTNMLSILMSGVFQLSGQVSVSTDNSNADPSAMLDVKSTTKGVLIPRMNTAEILAIPNPADGLQVYCKTDGKLYIFVASANQWKELAYGTGMMSLPATYSIGTGGSCNSTVVRGNYFMGFPLTTSNYVTIQVLITIAGTYTRVSLKTDR
jgi:hypothetical protein